MENFIEIKNLQKRFGSFTALHGLDLQIREGEFFTLLGPSGCAKTTSLRLIGGLEKPDGGEVYVAGQCLASPSRKVFVNPEKRNMGMVFQSYALWPHMTVFENVAYPLQLRWVKKADVARKVEEALALVGLKGLGSRPVPNLSGGQQQRVALARALVFSPRVLLLDEPLSNLDALLRDEMRKELKALQERLGLTVVLVTHDQIEALSLSDRVAILNQGRLEQIGTPETVYHRPTTAFVRDFLGKMFLLHGIVLESRADRVAVRLAGNDGQVLLVDRSDLAGNEFAPIPGIAVALAIRPEQLVVVGQAGDGQENVIEATVERAHFLGDRHEYDVSVGAERHSVLLPAGPTYKAGERIYFRLPSDKITLWHVDREMQKDSSEAKETIPSLVPPRPAARRMA